MRVVGAYANTNAIRKTMTVLVLMCNGYQTQLQVRVQKLPLQAKTEKA